MTDYIRHEYSGIENSYNLLLRYEEQEGKPLLLIIIDHVPSKDLMSGRLDSVVPLVKNIISYGESTYKNRVDYSLLFVNFNDCYTYTLEKAEQNRIYENFKQRIDSIICEYKPEKVLFFGSYPMLWDKNKRTIKSFYPFKATSKFNNKSHTYDIAFAPTITKYKPNDFKAVWYNIFGFCARILMTLCTPILKPINPQKEYMLIDTLPKVKKFFEKLKNYTGPVSFDTEDYSLCRVKNKILILQFATSDKKGYIIPIYHYQSPFLPNELKEIRKIVIDYFESNKNAYLIGANLKFDITMLRIFGVRFVCHQIWDILDAEHHLDENKIYLRNMCFNANYGETKGDAFFYSLEKLSAFYGKDVYSNVSFKKEDRGDIYKTPLNEELLEYCAYDVTIPFAIHKKQLEIAEIIGYKKYKNVVLSENGNTKSVFSLLEYNGIPLDKEYLISLTQKDSILKQEIEKYESQIINSKAGQEANKILTGNINTPYELWGKRPQVLDLNKPSHKSLLFFDVLKLKPVSFSSSTNKPSVDKAFQAFYEDKVEEVKNFVALSKAKKLASTYVNARINDIDEDPDFIDSRVRCSYNTWQVTHRTAAANPNMQQIPSHGQMAKIIKRMYIAPEGYILAKVDQSVFEIRGWGFLSGCNALKNVFLKCYDIKTKYRHTPTPELEVKLKTEADVHIQNASLFFNKAIEDVTEDDRYASKSCSFGYVYGKTISSMAKTLNRSEEEVKEIFNMFATNLPTAVNYIKNIKEFAARNYYVEAPDGIRRNLFAYLLPKSHDEYNIHVARNNRLAANAPIQGFCSKVTMTSLRILETEIFKLIKNNQINLGDILPINQVHDSCECLVRFNSFMKAIYLMEYCMTNKVMKYYKDVFNFEMQFPLQVDFEIGNDMSSYSKWDYSIMSLVKGLDAALTQQNILYGIDKEKAFDEIFRDYSYYPQWMIKQIKFISKQDYWSKLPDIVKHHLKQAVIVKS